MDQGVTDRINALSDIEAIRRLFVEYGRMLDLRDFAGYAELFAEDGEWCGVGAYGSVSGREAIAAFMAEAFGGEAVAPCVHLMTNMAIDVTGDHATAWSRWTLIEGPPGEPRPIVVLAGHYDDRLARDPAGWRFQRRLVSVDLPRLIG